MTDTAQAFWSAFAVSFVCTCIVFGILSALIDFNRKDNH